MKKKYVIMVLQDWDTLRLENGLPLDFSQINACGFLSVYSNLKTLKKDHPKQEYLTIISKKAK